MVMGDDLAGATFSFPGSWVDGRGEGRGERGKEGGEGSRPKIKMINTF